MVGFDFFFVIVFCNFVKSKLRPYATSNAFLVRRAEGGTGALSTASLAPAAASRLSVRPAVGEEGREAAVAIALMSGALANAWLVILPFRSLLGAEHKGDGETPASLGEKKGVGRAH